jgi:hypothetical protein
MILPGNDLSDAVIDPADLLLVFRVAVNHHPQHFILRNDSEVQLVPQAGSEHRVHDMRSGFLIFSKSPADKRSGMKADQHIAYIKNNGFHRTVSLHFFSSVCCIVAEASPLPRIIQTIP